MRTGEVKEIRLKGLSSRLNDYECEDGELQVCHNAINKGAGLRPIQEPSSIRTLPAGWVGLVFVHHTSNGDIRIVVDGDSNAYWNDDGQDDVKIDDPADGLFSEGHYQLTSIGNVMIVNFRYDDGSELSLYNGVHYYRWKNGVYKYLGQAPPDIQLEFSTVHYNGTVDDSGSPDYENGYTIQTDNQNQEIKFTADLQFTQGSMLSYEDRFEDYPNWLDFMLGRINEIKAEMRRQGLFLGKFFVRTAYKLYDGTYIMQSAPVLIAPSLEDNPMIWPYKISPRLKSESAGDYWEIGVSAKILYRPFVLVAKTLISDGDAEILKDWNDVIDRVCVFITPEIQDYTEDPRYMQLTRKEKILGSGGSDDTVIDGRPISSLVDASQAEDWLQGAFRSYTSEGITWGETVRRIYSPPLIEDGELYDLPEGSDASDQYSKHMVMDKQEFTLGFFDNTNFSAQLYHHQNLDIETTFTRDETEIVHNKSMLAEFGGFHHIIQFEKKSGTEKERIEQQYLFYPLCEYTVEDALKLGKSEDTKNKTMEWPYMGINLSSDVWPRKGETINAPADVSFVKFNKDRLENLTADTETLTDDYNSWQKIMPDVIHVYNNRLNMASVTIKFRDVPCTWLGGQAGKGAYNLYGRVVIETNGVIIGADIPEYLYYNLDVNVGYFYYPQPDAKKIQILATNDQKTEFYLYEIPLTTHPFMHGAYFFEEDFDIENYKTTYSSEEEAEAALDETDGVLSFPNYLYTSEVDNPFFFPAEGLNAVGTGRILAIRSATKAMSEGTAYGAMPLYAFCTDGIWPLSVGENGLFVATNPPTRETLINNDPEALLQIDDSVIFLSDRGLMQLIGERTSLLSGDLQERFSTFDVANLPKWNDISEIFDKKECLEADDFLSFIKSGARMAFDYVNYRIIVFKPYIADDAATHTAYMYDIGAKMWATFDSRIKSSLEGYPASLVNMEADDGSIIVGKFDSVSTSLINGGKAMYTTRPMKLGKPDLLKTARTLVERSISHGGVKYLALWGSRNLTDWSLIGAVSGGKMPRISGSPYKYYIVAGWSLLNVNGDCISRLTFEERDKYLNKLR